MFFFVVLYCIPVYSQDVFIQTSSSDLFPQDSNKLFLLIESSCFFKNNEYFNKISEGYTLPGFFIAPGLTYYPGPKTKIGAGLHLLKYSGKEKFTSIQPVFTFRQQLSKNIDLVLGTIYGTASHHLIEPVFKYERYFTHHVENGVQFLFNFSYFNSDVWLNWEHFIFPGDTLQEEFTAGTSSRVIISGPGKNLQLSIPMQAIVTHKGGQINNNDNHLQTLANIVSGVSVEYHFAGGMFSSIGMENYIAGYKDLSPTKLQVFSSGYAVYPGVFLNTTDCKLSGGFWYASGFIAPRGEELFQSISFTDTLYAEKERKVLTTKFIYFKELYRGVTIDARFESYYDAGNKNFDYSYGLHLLFNDRFFLRKLRD